MSLLYLGVCIMGNCSTYLKAWILITAWQSKAKLREPQLMLASLAARCSAKADVQAVTRAHTHTHTHAHARTHLSPASSLLSKLTPLVGRYKKFKCNFSLCLIHECQRDLSSFPPETHAHTHTHTRTRTHISEAQAKHISLKKKANSC